MKEMTTGTDTRESRELRGEVMAFDLLDEVERLRAEPEWAERGRTSKTLAKAPEFRLVLTLLREGAEIGDADAHAPLAVQVLDGRILAGRSEERVDIDRGGVAWFSPGPGWHARAASDAALLLAMAWPEERAEVEPTPASSAENVR
ncbi:MAG: hypothetical protein ACJ77N_10315 [Chloroflexota bacterium]